ncbi:histidine kinase [Polaribacter sp. MSW13]|uniref:Histidine kinase n=1 Tax=Polaribacter marinus TaxID=2916838 RepID=A0A9X1VMA7_9FLAO|nr:histidine kinase [Polaribacter marinus]MCI2228603.1 histidine kinase [Polaribacter marinus]
MANVTNLPDIEFYDIIEDKENYIWLAADKGLYRYNGKSYQLFKNPQQKGNSIFQLKLDQHGKLWCNNINGQIFYVENNELKLFFDANLLVKGQLSPYSILEDKIRIFTINGVFDISKKDKKVTQFFEGNSIGFDDFEDVSYAFVINETKDKDLHYVYKIKQDTIKVVLKIKSKTGAQSPKIFTFKKEALINFKEKGLNKLYSINVKTNKSQQLNTPSLIKYLTIYNIVNLEDNYWFLTTAGVFVFKLENNKLKFIEQLFETESITDLEVDFNSNYWFTTLDNGVFVSPNLSIRHTFLNNLKDKITAACTLNNNEFLLGTNTGKLLFYKEAKLIKTLTFPGSKIIGNLFYLEKEDQVIVSINASESFIVNLKNDKIIDKKNKFSVAKTFSELENNNLFYGNYKEAIIYHKPLTSDSLNVIRKNRVKTSLFTNNQLLVSFIDGLYTINPITLKQKELKFKNKSILVNSIAKTTHNIWLATQHNGLLQLENDTLKPVSIANKLQINYIKSEDNFLWISAEEGLYKYNTITNEIKHLNAQDGLNISVNQFIILEDNLVVILPNSFFILPKTKQLFKQFKTSKIKIDSILINDKDTLVGLNYELPYYKNKIKIYFNSNGFESNKNVSYQFKIKEIDTIWQQIPLNTHFVMFNNLPNGKFTFELQGKNLSAKNAISTTPITFLIEKPFWQTYWFYFIIFLLLFGVIWLFFKWKLKQKETQRKIEIDKILKDKKIANLRLENLRSQMNPHFIFNALNSIQDYIISNEKELASSYLVKFSRLIRMYLDYSQQNEITLEEELNALKLYLELEKVRFEEELEYNIAVDNQLKTRQIKVPSLFIQPYVENALKHGLLHKLNDRKLLIEAKIIQQNKLQITVEDNGIGRVQSEKLKRSNQQHKPFATKANKERVHLYKNKLKRNITIEVEDLYDENQIASGTRVVIIMPT